MAEADDMQHERSEPVLVGKHPICLSFNNLEFSVKVKKGHGFKDFLADVRDGVNPFRKEAKQILHSMSGHFLPSRLVAIMGPSGAGKSTFLNLLSNRLPDGFKSGQVQVNGHHMKRKQFRSLSAYVLQDDALLGNLTPRESLRYSARLRLPRTMSRKEKKQRVEEVIRRMNLIGCADTVIGYPGLKRGISGGERKRTSVALELLTSPMVLFLDEPTSGLDSATALSLVRHLKSLAEDNRTVICTIHQPSTEMLQLFDDVFFLSAGQLLYSGPVLDLPSYFKNAGFPLPQFVNPADHIMGLITRDPDEAAEDVEDRITTLAEHYTTHNNLISVDEHAIGVDLTQPPPMTKGGVLWHVKLWVLFTRSFKQRLRDPGNTYQRLVENIVISIFAGLLFLQLGHDQEAIRDRVGVLFLLIIFSVFATGNSVLYVFPQERATFLREYASRSYGVGAYYLAKSFAELPFNVVFPIIFGTITYWMVGLRNDAGAFFVNITAIILICNIAQSMGLLVSVGLELQQAITLFPVLVTPSMLVGGLYLAVNNIPDYFVWLQYLSFFFYAYMTLLINEFDDTSFYCTPGQLVNGICPITSGSQVIDSYGFSDYAIWIGFLGMILLFFLFRFLAFLALWLLARRKSTT